MGRKAIFNVKALKIGEKLPFKGKKKYIYQYLNNFNRSGEGRKYEHIDLEGTFYIKRTA